MDQATKSMYRASYVQQWFWKSLDPRSNPANYNVTQAFWISGYLDQQTLRDSLDRLIRRHDALRTGFELVSGELVQVVHTHAQARVNLADWRHKARESVESMIAKAIATERQIPFELLTPPLLRCHIFLVVDDQQVLIITLHYLIADGWSFAILLEELSEIYNALSAERPPLLPSADLQFSDYVAWQWELVQTQRGRRHRAYWRSCLGGQPDLGKPYVATSTGTEFSVAHKEVSLSIDVAAGLSAFGRRHGATEFMVYLSAFVDVLHGQSSALEVAVGTLVSGRRLAEFERMIGLLVNPLLLRIPVPQTPNSISWLAAVRDTVLEAFEHQDVSFPVVQTELDDPAMPTLTFRVLFNMPPLLYPSVKLVGTRTTRLLAEVHSVLPLDLCLAVVPHNNGVYISARYNREAIPPDQIKSLITQFCHALQSRGGLGCRAEEGI